MPIVSNTKVDSFTVNHELMKDAPFVRIAKKMITPSGDDITVFDLRFCVPNEQQMSVKGGHSLEHLMAYFMRDNLDSKKVKIISSDLMGCKTGFYLSVIGTPSEKKVVKAWKQSMQDILKTDEIGEANIYQCGTYKEHSLIEAKGIAYQIVLSDITIKNNEDILLSDEDLEKIAQGEIL